jgi:hypothetical protein
MRAGELAFDRFEIEAEAGAGGMGAVYRARDRHGGGVVALKVMHGLGGDALKRFEREAALLLEIVHPSIVRYVAHGPSWIAMEWLEGEDLEARLARDKLTLHDTIAVARAAAAALGAAHARGVVHRDVKPANLWLVSGDPAKVKLLDFGIARAVVTSSLTGSGTIVGTPAYMAPEQARSSKEVDARADVFSLGCVLYECLAGRPAFVGESFAGVLAKVLLEEVPPLAESAPVPGDVDALVARMLSKDPDGRPSSGDDVVRELDALDLTIASQRHPGQRPALGRGEQKLVSVVLVERKGDVAKTGEASASDVPAEVIEGGAITNYKRVAEEYGGRAEGLVDGSVVVLLGLAGAPTDQARRAATCALALSTVPGGRLVLATGRADASVRLPVSDAVDRAARLLRAPRPARGVRVDQLTASLLDTRFELEGDAAGLAVVSLRERREAVRTLLGKPTPCVGRDGDLAVLEGALARTIEDEVAGAVIVTAPPGVGKTRLAHELLQRLRARPAVQVWRARGDPVSGGPFGLCAQMVRAQAGVQAGEPLESRREKLRARVRRHVREDMAARVTDFLGELVGTEFPDNEPLDNARRDPVTMGDQIRRAFVDFVQAESRAGPLLLVLDDLQWADAGTIEAVAIALDVCREDRSWRSRSLVQR